MGAIGFDNQKYLTTQSEQIKKRIHQFGGKLYLEFGGKLFDDYHASRVLPGFEPDSKIRMLQQLKDDVEIVIAINAGDIEKNKMRGDLGITYDEDVLRLIDIFRDMGLYVGSVVLTRYSGQDAANAFLHRLEKLGIRCYRHYPIAGYPSDVAHIVSDEGLAITSMVWVLCSGLVGIVCITVMVAVGVFDPETFGMVDWESWKQLWGMLYGELGARFWLVTFWTILINLARLASLILCVYAACMIAHQFPKHVMVAGILAFIGLNIVETQLDKLLGTNQVNLFMDITYRVADVNVTGVTYGMTPMQTMTTAFGAGSGYLFCFVVTSAFAAAYFFLTRWLMKNKLNLE